MAYDDDDEATILRPAKPPAGEEADENEDRAPDYRILASMLNKKGRSSQEVRKGEKDFEEHGTRAQEDALETSRRVMEEVLSYERHFTEDNWVRAWYFPDWWVGEQGSAICEGNEKIDKRDLLLEDRVAIVEHTKRFPARLLGRVVPGVKRKHAASGQTWLLPEEALFLVERGSMELWWPNKTLPDLFPPLEVEGEGQAPASMLKGIEDDEYETGLPLSLQGAYSMLIGFPGERGKVPLARFQVYSTLKRAGFHVMPVRQGFAAEPQAHSSEGGQSLWRWLVSLISSSSHNRTPPSLGPLVRPGLYHSYNPIFHQLAIIPRHKPATRSAVHADPDDPFRIHYNVWKAEGSFRKGNPPPPDFRVCVVDTRNTPFPTLEQITALLESAPYDPPPPVKAGVPAGNVGQMHLRLKHGYRNVLIAAVDHGITSFNRFSDAGFGEEVIFEGFDDRVRGAAEGKRGPGKKSGQGPRGGKRGGKRGGRRGGG